MKCVEDMKDKLQLIHINSPCNLSLGATDTQRLINEKMYRLLGNLKITQSQKYPARFPFCLLTRTVINTPKNEKRREVDHS